jgi:DNA modification methylase
MNNLISCKDIVFREDLYPRFEPNQALIQQYAYSLEYLPPIKINQNNILIDGFHRWKAFQLAGVNEIPFEVIVTDSEKMLKRLAYQLNSNHGLQLSGDEKRKYAQEMYGDLSSVELAQILCVDERTVRRWTETQREAAEQERKRLIIELYLRAWNTQESIASIVGMGQSAIAKIIENIKSGQVSEFNKSFVPYIYNIWNLQKQDNATTSHFGSFPLVFMRNLLHFHTEPLDIIFDPFAGGGTTIDACKEMFRRYYCTDRIVKPGREKDILQHDITKGFPEGLPKPAMIFLDPPYWLLAKGEYSEDDDDLGNMTKEQFYQAMNAIALESTRRKIERVAYLIRPIWDTGSDGWAWNDPMFELWGSLNKSYYIEARYVIPYSTQQYTALWVERAKKANKCLILNRELTVLRRR